MKKTKDLTAMAMLCAITMVLAIVPNIGIIQIGIVSLTVLHIPVIIGANMYGVKGGLILGTVFGLSSLFVAATRGATPVDLMFVNPLVSVLPRMLFGLISGLLSSLNKNKKTWINAVTSFVSTIIHSFLVYTAIYLYMLNGAQIDQSFVPFIVSAFTVNSLLEAAVASVVVLAVMKVVGNKRWKQ